MSDKSILCETCGGTGLTGSLKHNEPYLDCAPAAQEPVAPTVVTDEMVRRFLSWPIPKDFAPDCGISFDGRKDDDLNVNKTWPIGTNLLNDPQARSMLEHVIGTSAPVAQEPVAWPARADEGMIHAMLAWRCADADDEMDRDASVMDRIYYSLYSYMREERHAAPVVAQVQVPERQLLSILNAYEAGVGKGREALRKGASTGNPYTDASDCAVAWGVGFDEGKSQAKRDAGAPVAGQHNMHAFFAALDKALELDRPVSAWTGRRVGTQQERIKAWAEVRRQRAVLELGGTTQVQPNVLPDTELLALLKKHLGLNEVRGDTVIDPWTGRFCDVQRYRDFANAILAAAQAQPKAPLAEGEIRSFAEALTVQRENEKRDAERYRWLRDPCSGAERVIYYSRGDYGNGLYSRESLDTVIDAAIAKANGGAAT